MNDSPAGVRTFLAFAYPICVPVHRFLRTLCVPLVRTLRGTQKGTQKNPASVDLERLPDFSVVTVGLEPVVRKLYSRDCPQGRSLLKV